MRDLMDVHLLELSRGHVMVALNTHEAATAAGLRALALVAERQHATDTETGVVRATTGNGVTRLEFFEKWSAGVRNTADSLAPRRGNGGGLSRVRGGVLRVSGNFLVLARFLY